MAQYGCAMHGQIATTGNAATGAEFRIRRDVYERLMAEAGAKTQFQQVQMTGVPRRSLYRIIHGGEPSMTNAMRIANALHVSFEVLFEQVENR